MTPTPFISDLFYTATSDIILKNMQLHIWSFFLRGISRACKKKKIDILCCSQAAGAFFPALVHAERDDQKKPDVFSWL